MGEVYRARDTRLDRTIAIKVLRADVVSDPERRQRFAREARAISRLNHPHICILHDIGREGDTDFLVMEHLLGETLAERLGRGALPVDEALRYAIEIGRALESAHQAGVVHRDLKPGNIMLTTSGAKLLDFGLAKLWNQGSVVQTGMSSVTTLSQPLSEEGRILGTVQYMAPEQLGGQDADARTDIFAFGTLVYEMVTGRKAFEATSTIGLMSAILKDTPPSMAVVRPGTSPFLAHLVDRCLAKNPNDRWQSVGDVAVELEWAKTMPDVRPVPATRMTWLPWSLAGISILIALLSLAWPEPVPVTRRSAFVVSLDTEMSRLGQRRLDVGIPVPSPDGRYLAFRGDAPDGGAVLWVRPLDATQAHPLLGTQGTTDAVVWSPDGEWLGFFADGRLKRIRLSGGPPETIAELPGFQDAAWGSQGDILYRPDNRMPLFVIHESGGPPRQVTRLDSTLGENSHRGPEFLPDGRRFLYTSRSAERSNNVLYLASLDSPEVRRVMAAEAHVSAVPRADGSVTLFYYSEGALLARQFDPVNGTFTGASVQVTDNVAYNAASIRANYRISQDGSVIVVQQRDVGGAARLTWFRRDGEQIATAGSFGAGDQVRIAPDGRAVLYEAASPVNGNRDIWRLEFARNIIVSLTTNGANDWYPVWAPDGNQMLFGSDRSGTPEVVPYLKTSLDPGMGEVPLRGLEPGAPTDWSRDGRWIAFTRQGDVWVASAQRDADPFPFVSTPASEGDARFSPDGRWIAYASNETGAWEVQVRSFDGRSGGAGDRIQISPTGGDFPVWGPDGRELFYMSADSVLHAVDVSTLQAGTPIALPERLFQACPDGAPISSATVGTPYRMPFDTRDGERFLISCVDTTPGRFLVLLDWRPAT